MDYIEWFHNRVAELRIQKGVSARDMSLSLGQSESYINKIENKRTLIIIQCCLRHTLGILRCFKDVENIFKVVQLLFWHLQFSHKTCPHPCTFSAS